MIDMCIHTDAFPTISKPDRECMLPYNRLFSRMKNFTNCDRAWENLSYVHINCILLFVCTWKLHSCTTQKYQVLEDRWPGLLSQTAYYWCYKTTRMHFSALRGITRAAWGTRMLLTAVLANPVDCTSSGLILRAQHCCLSPNGCFSPPSASYPPPPPPNPLPTHPPPIDSIRDVTGSEKTYPKHQQHSNSW